MARVQYDDAAFFIFAISVLSVYAFPATYLILGKLLRATVFAKPTASRRLLKGEEEKSRLLKEKTGKEVWSACFIFQLVTLVIVWTLLFILLTSYSSGGDIKQFDPYEILNVDHDSTSSQIRSAFRKLSLKYHPDKNPGDPEAANMFMLISKAHDALTDEEAKKNFEEFGSPDGKQQMQVSIGLPSFFMSKANHTPILIVYLIILVVMVPIGVGTYYASSIKYGENDIMKATYDKILTLFKPQDMWNSKLLPEILGAAEEFADLKYSKADTHELEKLYKKWLAMAADGNKVAAKPKIFNKKFIEQLIKQGRAGESNHTYTCFLNNICLTAYMMRCKLSSTNMQKASTVLTKSPIFLEAMIKMALQISNSWMVINELIIFEQRLYQCLWDSGDRSKQMFFQLPHITDNEAKYMISRGRKARKDAGVLSNIGFQAHGQMQAFLRTPEADRKGLKDFSDSQKRDVHDVAALLPNWDVDIDIFVDEEDIISAGAFVTVKFVITRNEIKEGETAKEIFAPRYPIGKFEGIWLVMSDFLPPGKRKNQLRIKSIKKLNSTERVVTGILQFRAPQQPAHYSMLVSVRSDCYFGCDFHHQVSFEVKAADSPELTVYELHEEDHELLKELHGEVVGNGSDSDSDSDSDASDDDDDVSDDDDDDDAPESKTNSKKQSDRTAVKEEEESEESESDSETSE
jgi:translocation protein SEC63